jgi:hypothetical protein
MKFDAIESQKTEYPVTVLCRVLDVSKSGYYEWRAAAENRRERDAAQSSNNSLHFLIESTNSQPIGTFIGRQKDSYIFYRAGQSNRSFFERIKDRFSLNTGSDIVLTFLRINADGQPNKTLPLTLPRLNTIGPPCHAGGPINFGGMS